MTTKLDSADPEPQISTDLVKRLARGDREAIDDMDRRYRRGLVFLIMRRTGDMALAEDICQDTLITAIEKLCPIDGHAPSGIDKSESLGAFLRGIALNKLIGVWRKQTRRATTADTETVDDAVAANPGPLEELEIDETRVAVRAILDEMPVPRDRDILISAYLRDEDRDSICRRHGIDAAHLNRVLSRAKKRFREAVERADADRRRVRSLQT